MARRSACDHVDVTAAVLSLWARPCSTQYGISSSRPVAIRWCSSGPFCLVDGGGDPGSCRTGLALVGGVAVSTRVEESVTEVGGRLVSGPPKTYAKTESSGGESIMLTRSR